MRKLIIAAMVAGTSVCVASPWDPIERLPDSMSLEEVYQEGLRQHRADLHRQVDICKGLSKWEKKLVKNGEITLGMSEKALVCSWGKADHINKSVGPWGVHKQWVYGNGQYVYTENGKVTSWQQ